LRPEDLALRWNLFQPMGTYASRKASQRVAVLRTTQAAEQSGEGKGASTCFLPALLSL
jgi:hypothetical protein